MNGSVHSLLRTLDERLGTFALRTLDERLGTFALRTLGYNANT